jgi:prepilin-type N-terminal cleavage/methylation domain-containing protein
MEQSMKKQFERGFTMVEMLVVIAIITILMSALVGGFFGVQTLAWQSRSQELVSNVSTALNLYIQRERSWPDEILNSNGNVNNEVCKVLQAAKLLDVTTVKFDADGVAQINQNSPERFGLFSPWGQRIIRKSPTMSATLGTLPSDPQLIKHMLQFRVDINLDGKIDVNDGKLGTIPGDGATIRASAIVWSCGPQGKAEGNWGAKRPQDNRQSWGAGK